MEKINQMKYLLIILSTFLIGCNENEVSTPPNISKPEETNAKNELNSILKNEENNQTIDVLAVVLDENNDTVNDCNVFIAIKKDSNFYHTNDSNWIFMSLPLGHQYYLGFKKEGYMQKHLIIDVIEYGGYENSKYGFEFPMQLHLVPGDTKATSKYAGRLEYVDSTGYIDNVLVN